MNTRLREVTTDEQPQQVSQHQAQANAASLQLLLLALKALSQRSIIALAALRGLMLAGAVFWLAYVVVQDPSSLKLTGLGIFSVFVLLAEWMAKPKV